MIHLIDLLELYAVSATYLSHLPNFCKFPCFTASRHRGIFVVPHHTCCYTGPLLFHTWATPPSYYNIVRRDDPRTKRVHPRALFNRLLKHAQRAYFNPDTEGTIHADKLDLMSERYLSRHYRFRSAYPVSCVCLYFLPCVNLTSFETPPNKNRIF